MRWWTVRVLSGHQSQNSADCRLNVGLLLETYPVSRLAMITFQLESDVVYPESVAQGTFQSGEKWIEPRKVPVWYDEVSHQRPLALSQSPDVEVVNAEDGPVKSEYEVAHRVKG